MKPGSKRPAAETGHGATHTKARGVQQAARPSSLHQVRKGKALHRTKTSTFGQLFTEQPREQAPPHLQACRRSEIRDGRAGLAEHAAVVCGRPGAICLGDPDAKRLRLLDIWLLAAHARKVGKSSVEPEFNQREGAAEAARFQRSLLLDCKLFSGTRLST